MSRELPSFDLVVATVGRTDELARLLGSLAAQDYPQARVLLVDQNDDERVAAVIASSIVEIVRLRSAPGLSRARNVALPAWRLTSSRSRTTTASTRRGC